MISPILPTITIAALALAATRASELLRGRAPEPVPCADRTARQVAWEYAPETTFHANSGREKLRARWIPIRRDKAC